MTNYIAIKTSNYSPTIKPIETEYVDNNSKIQRRSYSNFKVLKIDMKNKYGKFTL